MEPNLQLGVFMLLLQVSLATWRHIAVREGQKVELACPITPDPHLTNVEWQNPARELMFFSSQKVLKDQRYSIEKLSATEFIVSISDITFKDGGNYTCFQHGRHTIERTVEVTVYDSPKIRVIKHDGRFVIKCSAKANHYPPHISWKFNQGPEILAHAQIQRENTTLQVTNTKEILLANRQITVKCIVRNPALHLRPLIDFIKIRPDSFRHTTTTRSPSTQGSTEVHGTITTGTPIHHTTADVDLPSSASSEPVRLTGTTGFPLTSDSTGLDLSTRQDLRNSSPSLSTSRKNDNITNAKTGWVSVSNTTEDLSSNSTEENGGFVNPKMRKGSEGGSALLVFLVTCLIFGLLVVVIFFAIKLRRAHAIWKRENDESDQSVESSKSKSSQEEKNSQGQRRRGVLNTAFTQYIVEEPTVITSVINTAAMADAADSENQKETPARCAIKETEL